MSPSKRTDPAGGPPHDPLALRYSSASGRWVLTATVLGTAMAMIDGTVVGVALPSIGRDLHSSLSQLQWVVSGYLLTLAACLLLGGSLGDVLGRRKIFTVGVVWFAVCSLLCGIAPNAEVLIAMRALQGVGGALLTPGSLAIIEASFTANDRGRAIGAWSGLGGLASAAGPILGGYLVTAASWRFIFFINLPISVVVAVLAIRRVPESRDQSAPRSIDVRGGIFGIVALAGLTYCLIEGESVGWASPFVIAAGVIAVVGGSAFIVTELWERYPMLPLDIFRSRQLVAANAVTFVVYGALGGALFLLPLQLQIVQHYSAFGSGLAFLPVTLVTLLFSARSGRLATRIGPRLQMSLGPAVVGAGLILLVRANDGHSYAQYVLPGLLVFGAGISITVAPLTATAMNAVSPRHAGVASAVNNDVARFASLLAVATLPGVAGIPGTSFPSVTVLSHGFQKAMYIAAGLCVFGGVLAAIFISNKASEEEPEEWSTKQDSATEGESAIEGDAVTMAEKEKQSRGATLLHETGRLCGFDGPPLGVCDDFGSTPSSGGVGSEGSSG